MRKILLAGVLAAGLCSAAWGQNAVVNFKTSNTTPGSKPVTDTLGLPVNCILGCSGGGGAATIANGADVAEGSTTDAPATTPTTGSAATTIALLKALNNSNPALISNASSGIATSSVNVPNVSYNYAWNGSTWDQFPKPNVNGQTTMANSTPIAIASDQSTVPIGSNIVDSTSDTGGSVKIGGLVNTTNPVSATSGQRVPWWMGARGTGAVFVGNQAGTSSVLVAAAGTTVGTSNNGLETLSVGYWYDGTTLQIARGSSAGLFTLPGGFSYSHITTATTTTAKSGTGSVHTICINSLGTVASLVTVYDNTAGSGTVIAVINSLALLGCQTYDVAFATGLTLVTTGTVAPDVTVSYR